MLRATVDTFSLHRMRDSLSREAAPRRLFTRDHFYNVFGYPIEGEVTQKTQGITFLWHWISRRSVLGRLAAVMSDSWHPFITKDRILADRLTKELLQQERLTHFMQALARRLPPGGVPLQHLEDALVLAINRAPWRCVMSPNATAALRVAEALYDATFCATYAYYEEIMRDAGLAMAYAQAYAETVSGVALRRTLKQEESYHPILGGGGYYEYLEARQHQFLKGEEALNHTQVHFAPLRLLAGPSQGESAVNT
jgi:hypothetical protein